MLRKVVHKQSSNSQVTSGIEPENDQTPLILPDLSPTREDLDDSQTDESGKTSVSNDNDDDTTTSTFTDSDNSGTTENNAGDNSESIVNAVCLC